jgi:hypothetical protein
MALPPISRVLGIVMLPEPCLIPKWRRASHDPLLDALISTTAFLDFPVPQLTSFTLDRRLSHRASSSREFPGKLEPTIPHQRT